MLIETVERKAGTLRLMGRRAIAAARRAGVAAYYMDPRLGDGIIKELPDGTLQRIALENGRERVTETLKR